MLHGQNITHLLLYNIDIILTTYSSTILHHIITSLGSAFEMKDLAPLHHFLGIPVSQMPTTLHLSQQQYIIEVLNREGMRYCHRSPTLIDKQNFSPHMALHTLIRLIIVASQVPYNTLFSLIPISLMLFTSVPPHARSS
jgi:hypothetical protein